MGYNCIFLHKQISVVGPSAFQRTSMDTDTGLTRTARRERNDNFRLVEFRPQAKHSSFMNRANAKCKSRKIGGTRKLK